MDAENASPFDAARKRFCLKEGETLTGFIEYYAFGHIAIVTHTEIRQEIEGKGQGSELARRAVAYFRGDGKKIVPICGFFAHFLRKHPEHADIVTPQSRVIFKI
jgi:predicted GNAT family acetyltransferase